MIIWPLAITQVNWPVFIKTCQDVLDYSPTRGLDNSGIKPDAPCAFLACIGIDNDPLNQLRFGHITGKGWKHIHASFIAVISLKTLSQISNLSDLTVTIKKTDDNGDYLIIVSGDIRQWRDTVIKGCRLHDKQHKQLRELMNYCLVYFQESGFREVWHDCEKIGLEDGTFVVRMK